LGGCAQKSGAAAPDSNGGPADYDTVVLAAILPLKLDMGVETMKLLTLCSCVLTGLASTGYAADYAATGTVSALHSEDLAGRAESNWFSLAGVDSLGSCKASPDGHVVFLLADDKDGRRMFEIALASKASGAPLKIRVDDTVTGASGFCYVTAME
jgi:hypothetical protein